MSFILSNGLGTLPTGGGGGGGGTVVQKQVTRLGDFPQTASLTPWRITFGDEGVAVSIPLTNEDGRPVTTLTGEETATFNMRLKGDADSVIDDATATLSPSNDGGPWVAEFSFDATGGTNPIPEEGEYEVTFRVNGRTYPLGRKQTVWVEGSI